MNVCFILFNLVRSIFFFQNKTVVLQENVGDSYLIKIFSGVTSPRCYALIAFKRSWSLHSTRICNFVPNCSNLFCKNKSKSIISNLMLSKNWNDFRGTNVEIRLDNCLKCGRRRVSEQAETSRDVVKMASSLISLKTLKQRCRDLFTIQMLFRSYTGLL